VRCHGSGGRLLERLVGEQPLCRIVELRKSSSPQHRRLHENSGPLTETPTRPSDVGDQRGVGELKTGNVAQRLRAFGAPQIADIGEPEIYDGLTPVTITL
jgi:hypothetical protein